MKANVSLEKFKGKELYRGKGCPECFETGYKGRIGIFELMTLTDDLKRFILKTSDGGQIRDKALSLGTGMQLLKEDGLNKVLSGETTLEEVFRVT